jgi:hypothetical protein
MRLEKSWYFNPQSLLVCFANRKQVQDVIAEGKEVAQVLTDAYDVVKENTSDLVEAGQEKGAEIVEKGKGINIYFSQDIT